MTTSSRTSVSSLPTFPKSLSTILAPSRAGFEKPSTKNTGHNLSTTLLTNMHCFPPILTAGHGQDKAQGTMMLHHQRNNLSHPPPHVPNDQDAQNKSIQTPTNNTERPATPPPRRQHPPPPQQPPQPDSTNRRDYIPEQVGRSMYDSLKILGLGLGASEREVKLAYRRLASIFHPGKWEHSRHTTGMTLPETTAHFQMLNNAQSFL